MNFIGMRKKLDDIDLPKLGHLIGVGEDEIHAIIDVEVPNSSGFDTAGRPHMLFEPHIFYRLLKAHAPNKLQVAVDKGLAYKSWRRSYPKNSYPRLKEAMAINREIALQSASWGMGQMMGFNYRLCGYSSAESMVISFMNDEEEQLKAIITYLIRAKAGPALRAHNWREVARIYNGPQYEKNNYHIRLAKAYEMWSKIPDTEWKPKNAISTVRMKPIEDEPVSAYPGKEGISSTKIINGTLLTGALLTLAQTYGCAIQ